MTEKTCKTVRLVSGVLLSAMTVIFGALLIWQVLDIYISGTSADYTGTYVFTRARVGKGLLKILPAFVIWVVMIIAGFVLWEALPVAQKRGKPDVRYTLYRLKKRIPKPLSGDLQNSLSAVKREELILKILWTVAAVLCTGVAVYVIVYLALPSSFPTVEDKTPIVLKMVKNVMPFVLAAFAVCCGVAVYEGFSAKKQVKELAKIKPVKNPVIIDKIIIKAGDGKFYNGILKVYNFLYKHRIAAVRTIIGCLGVAFVIAGVCDGGMRDMLNKAIKICRECIGLG